MKVSTDWDGRNYGPLNGFHPLFRFLEAGPAADDQDTGTFVVCPYSEKLAAYSRFGHLFQTQLADICQGSAKNPPFAQTWKFFDAEEQFLTEVLAPGIYFCHTFPLSLGVRSFVFHLEDVKSLFLPLAAHLGVDIAAVNRHAEFEAYRQYIGSILASAKCLTIFCHYRETPVLLQGLFPEFALLDKIRMFDIVSLHRDYRDTLKQTSTARRSRLLYSHLYCRDSAEAVGRMGFGIFFDLCEKLRASDLADQLVPTLILPPEHVGAIPENLGIEVFYGLLPDDVHQSVLAETRFCFFSPVSIQTAAIVDCLLRDIVPICYQHTAYAELGLSDANSVNLGSLPYSALGFHDSSQYIPRPDLEGFLARVRQFVDGGSTRATENAPRSVKRDNAAISSIAEFKRTMAVLGAAAGPGEKQLYAGILQQVSPRHFATEPLFRVHARFNGLVILSNRCHYLYAHSDSQPAGLSELLYSGKYFQSGKKGVLFDGLTDLSAAVAWAVSPPLLAGGVLATLKRQLSRHKRLYLFVRSIYWVMKRVRRKLARGAS